jgi:nucleoside-diphosphate-sugar epimerase
LAKSILLTGATGFIGTAFAQFIDAKKNFGLTAVTRSSGVTFGDSVRVVNADDLVSDRDWEACLAGVEVIVHLAARAHILNDQSTDPLDEFRRTNVGAALALAKKAIVAGVSRFVFVSSIGVNGTNTTDYAFAENDKAAPLALYAISKHEAEQALTELCEEVGMELVIIRPPLVYAAHAPGNFRRLLRLVASGAPLPFALVKNRRSMVALENLVEFIFLCVTHPAAANQTFVVADAMSVSTPQMLKYLAQGMGKRFWLLPIPVGLMRVLALCVGKESLFDQLCGSLEVDPSKAYRLLDWSPSVSVEDAMLKAGKEYLGR